MDIGACLCFSRTGQDAPCTTPCTTPCTHGCLRHGMSDCFSSLINQETKHNEKY